MARIGPVQTTPETAMNPQTPAAPKSSWKTAVLTTLVATFSAGLIVLPAPARAAAAQALPPFEAISLQAPFDVTVRQTGREAVTVTAPPAAAPLVEAVVEAAAGPATLVIRVKPGQRMPRGSQVRVEVEVSRLAALALRGAGDVTVEALRTPALKLSVTGAGDALLRGLDTESLDLEIVGSGDVQADGRARQLQVSIAGSGDAELENLAAETVSVSIAGSGDASVRASRSVDVSIAGSGDVEVLGNPPSVRQSLAGSGELVMRR
jgi:Putative auto-transporter adhesin, head GIN domain